MSEQSEEFVNPLSPMNAVGKCVRITEGLDLGDKSVSVGQDHGEEAVFPFGSQGEEDGDAAAMDEEKIG